MNIYSLSQLTSSIALKKAKRVNMIIKTITELLFNVVSSVTLLCNYVGSHIRNNRCIEAAFFFVSTDKISAKRLTDIEHIASARA